MGTWTTLDAGRFGRWRVPDPDILATPAGQVAVRDSGGEGQPIICIHGWCADSLTNYFAAFEALSDIGRVVALDLPGHGATPLHGRFSLESCTQTVSAVSEALGLVQPVLIGYSMGGPITQLLIRQQQEHVGGAIYVATAARLIPSGARRLWLASLERGFGTGAEAARTIGHLWQPGGQLTQAESLASHARWLARVGNKRAMAEAAGELARYDSRTWVGQHPCPSVSVITTQDRGVPPAAQRELADLTGAAVLEASGSHFFCLDRSFGPTLARAVAALPGKSSQR